MIPMIKILIKILLVKPCQVNSVEARYTYESVAVGKLAVGKLVSTLYDVLVYGASPVVQSSAAISRWRGADPSQPQFQQP